jgi:hypothetical protein
LTNTVDDLAKLRLEVAERHVASVQSFHPRIDTKVTALFAVSSAQIAIVALNLSIEDFAVWYKSLLILLYVLTSGFIHFNLYLCTYPHLDAGSRALSFFGDVAKTGEAEFLHEYVSMSVDELTHDFARQIWRNSHIVAAKYRYLKISTIALFFSTLPWIGILAAVTIEEWKLPSFG